MFFLSMHSCRDHFTVEVPLPRLVFQTLPEELKKGQPLQVYPVLFNVGINEQQTIAERYCRHFQHIALDRHFVIFYDFPTQLPLFCLSLRFGDISLQERINQKNFEMLEAYYKSLSEKVPTECKCTTFSCL